MTPQAQASAATEATIAAEADAIRAIPLDDAARRRLGRMFSDHHGVVFRVIRRMGIDPARAEDGAQQVFMIAARRLDDIVSGKERAFLIGAALNTARRLRRERAHQAMGSEPPRSGPGTDDLVDRKRKRELLDRLLDEMEEDLRVVLVLAKIEGQAKREISDALGIPEGTVASRLRRASDDFLARLKRHQASSAGARGRVAG
ncbi:MAG: sigma-70 family RNA polymerase sigma factor [Labilithrix sp.]|nr:sigma-70 family RNA polymerase sigma factor [Labilithrix sp.]